MSTLPKGRPGASRTANLGIGLVVLLLVVLWCIFAPFVVLYFVFGVGSLLGLRAAFRSFRRAQLDARGEHQSRGLGGLFR